MFSRIRKLVLITAGMLTCASLQAGPADPKPVEESWWKEMHRYQKEQLSGSQKDICWIGDSLTEYWNHHGRVEFEKAFSRYKSVNCGIGGDTTENILWRIENLGLTEHPPRLIVLMMGTNNLGKESADSVDAVVLAIGKAVAILKDTPVILISILPSGDAPDSPLRHSIKSANARLASLENVTWLDVHGEYLEPDGRWKPGLTFDGTHLTAAGYQILARRLAPIIERELAPPENPFLTAPAFPATAR